MGNASGRDRIERVLRRLSGRVIVFADLCAVGRAYRLLMKRCGENKAIRFYDYDSFECLLCYSKLFREKALKSVQSSFSFITLERYYESVIAKVTMKTDFQYVHGRPLPKIYSLHWCELLDSEMGKPLLELLNACDSSNCKTAVKVNVFSD